MILAGMVAYALIRDLMQPVLYWIASAKQKMMIMNKRLQENYYLTSHQLIGPHVYKSAMHSCLLMS